MKRIIKEYGEVAIAVIIAAGFIYVYSQVFLVNVDSTDSTLRNLFLAFINGMNTGKDYSWWDAIF